MPTLLQINSDVNTGSTGRIAEQLGQLAMNNGWISYIAYGRDMQKSRSHLIKIGCKLDVYTHVLLSRITDKHGLYSRIATKRFLRKVDEINPDVVHLHNLHGYYINVPMLLTYLKERKIPSVITMHDFWLMTGHCAYINKVCDKWKTGCGNCPRLNQYPAAIIDESSSNFKEKESLFENADSFVLVPVSNWLNGFVKQSLLKNISTEVIYNGIDTSVFKPFDSEESLSKEVDWGKFTILSVATRWTDANGFADVMALSRMVSDDCQIIIVGVDTAQQSELPHNVIGIERTENLDQLRELYTKSDVLFNPNTEVTFGLVTAEAMACGTPAIVLKDTAGEEIVGEGIGYVVNGINEIPAIISSIRESNAKEIAEKCRERVRMLYDSKKQYQIYLDLYNRLIHQ